MRRLATGAISYSAAVFLSRYLLPLSWQPWCVLAMFLPVIAALLWQGDKRIRLLLIAIPAGVGFLWTWGQYQLVFAPAEALSGETLAVQIRVTEYAANYEDYSVVDGELETEGLPEARIRLYLQHESARELRPGDWIEGEYKLRSAADSSGKERTNLTSKGISLCVYSDEPVEISGFEDSLRYFPQKLSRSIAIAAKECFPVRVDAFMQALLTGDRTDFNVDPTLSEDMGRAGLLHIVAISGMHVAFLTGFVQTVTRSRRLTAALCVPLILLFIPMTGGSPSVIRAGFMQLALLMAPLAHRENDAVTTLSAVLALLLLINPRAAADVGLQLSFACMAGILLVTPRVYKAFERLREGRRRIAVLASVMDYVLASMASSVGAMVFSTPLAAIYFGYVPLYSVFTNILCLWAMSLCFTAGYFICFIWMMLPVAGTVLSLPVTALVRFVIAVVEFISALPYAAIYTRANFAAWWLAGSYAVFLFSWLLRGKERGYRPVLPACLCVIMLCTALLASHYLTYSSAGTITVLEVGQGQSVVFLSGDKTVVIDCGSARDGDTAADAVKEYLRGLGRNRIDLLVLTHFHDDHANGAPALLRQMQVGAVFAPQEEAEPGGLAEEISALAEEKGTDIRWVTSDMTITSGDAELRLFAPIGSAGVNERGVIVALDLGEYECLITGDVNALTEQQFVQSVPLPDMELLVAGHHGSADSTGEALLSAIKAETAIISVGEDNIYGHPARETLERLAAFEMEIYRTDKCGNVTVRVG